MLFCMFNFFNINRIFYLFISLYWCSVASYVQEHLVIRCLASYCCFPELSSWILMRAILFEVSICSLPLSLPASFFPLALGWHIESARPLSISPSLTWNPQCQVPIQKLPLISNRQWKPYDPAKERTAEISWHIHRYCPSITKASILGRTSYRSDIWPKEEFLGIWLEWWPRVLFRQVWRCSMCKFHIIHFAALESHKYHLRRIGMLGYHRMPIKNCIIHSVLLQYFILPFCRSMNSGQSGRWKFPGFCKTVVH